MAKPRTRKLKVFQAQFGFFDSVVAAPSQAAALRAWDTHQNLFASGKARVTTDDAAVAAAIAHPQTPLRRAAGSNDPFQLEPASLPKVPHAPRPKRVKASSRREASTPRPEADRSALDAAEAALHGLDERRKQEERDLDREHAALQDKRTEAQAAYVEGRKSATSAVVAARQAYRKAGGAS